MLLDYLLPILQDSIITDKVRAVNHYLEVNFSPKAIANQNSCLPFRGIGELLEVLTLRCPKEN